MANYPDQDLGARLPSGSPVALEFYDSQTRSGTKVALNDFNTLVVKTHRLPIGWKVTMPTDVGRLRIWVPSDHGGELTIWHLAGGDRVRLVKDGNQLGSTSATSAISHHVSKTEFGEYFVLRQGGTTELEIGCTFEQETWATDNGTPGPPLVPWNFWYWPINPQKSNPPPEHDCMAILKKYAEAVGKPPQAAVDWETSNHRSTGQPEWAGHCHQAAGASLWFEVPATRTVGKRTFTPHEQKFLAAEYFANFSNNSVVWEINPDATDISQAGLESTFQPAIRGLPILRALKPNEVHGQLQVQLVAALKRSSTTKDHADALATEFIRNAGGEDAARTKFARLFGRKAATLFSALGDLLGGNGGMVGDLRSRDPQGTWDEIWNHAIFYMRTKFQETPGTYDERDMTIVCRLGANADMQDDDRDDGVPAVVNPKTGHFEFEQHEQRFCNYRWRLFFDSSATLNRADQRSEWIYARSDGNVPGRRSIRQRISRRSSHPPRNGRP
jgi:hypothetical protein